MRKLKYIVLFLLLSTTVFGAPSATMNIPNSFSPNTTISSSAVNANFNEISSKFNTHTHSDITQLGVVTSGTWAASPVQYGYLNLTGSIVNADISSSAAIVGSKLDLTSPGGIGTTTPAAGKFTSLEATSTLKLGSTNQGDVLYDNGTSLVRLTPGTSGQVLQTQGTSANPTWANAIGTIYDYGSSASSSTSRQATAIKVAFGELSITGNSNSALSNLPFSSSTSYSILCSFATATDAAEACVAKPSSGSAATLYNNDNMTETVNWIAIGI